MFYKSMVLFFFYIFNYLFIFNNLFEFCNEIVFKKSLRIFNISLWDYYFGLVISTFIFFCLFFITFYIIKIFNKNNFNSLNLDLIFFENKYHFNLISSINYLDYIAFSLCFLGIPIFTIFTNSYSYGGLFVDIDKNLISFILNVLTFQWGFDFYLLSFKPIYFTRIFYPISKFIKNISISELFLNISNYNLLSEFNFFIESNNFYNFEEVFKINIIIPNRTPILIKTFSKDVNHCLGIIDLGLKLDSIGEKILVGYMNIFTTEGKQIDFLCFEYCGNKHSDMIGSITILNFLYLNFLL
uniref:cytochrome c oxidase subunit II n=1 Tax=Myxobolus shantungensis TaxID=904554 RepID=UPI003001C5FC